MSPDNVVEEGQTEEATASTEEVGDITDQFVVEGDGDEATIVDDPTGEGNSTGSEAGGQTTDASGGSEEENQSDEQNTGADENTSSQTSRHKTGDERFVDLTREKYEAEAAATVAENKYQQVLAELESLKNQKTGDATDDGKPKLLTRPRIPTRESVEYDDNAYAEAMDQYQDDLEAYHDQQFDLRYQKREETRLNQVAKDQQAEVAQGIEDTFQKRQAAFIAKPGADGKPQYPDYQTAVFTEDVKITTVVANAIKEAENGPELLYRIAKSPKLMNHLLTVSPTQALIELGKLSANTKSSSKEKKVTNAPDPIDPLESSGGTNLHQTMETMPIGDFMAAEEKKYYGDA
jgi:hypothetical protein